MSGDRRAAVIAAFRDQIRWCGELDAPFMRRLLLSAVIDLESDGFLAQRIGDWPGDPGADALPIRVAGALHALVLSGRAPEPARHYPPHDISDTPWPAAIDALKANEALLDDYLRRAPQTNEIGRSALLYAGFGEIARRRGPLRLLEIGASAGLNMQWDRYRYLFGDVARGDHASVELRCDWQGALPAPVAIEIAERRGCDLNPIDLTDPAQRLRLRSYIWPDQPHRMARLDAAIELALRTRLACVERADALTWLPAQLSTHMDGVTTVVYHTVVWMYLPPATRAALKELIHDAGNRATDARPLAWLSFEFPDKDQAAQLRLTEWPGGLTRTLAQAHPHGDWIRWVEPPVS